MRDRDALITATAGKAHDAWRRAWRRANGDQPRIKRTTDAAWIARHELAEFDLAATDYVDLPGDWQRDNRASAEIAVDALLEQRSRGAPIDDEFVEQAAERIHVGWLARNAATAPAHQRLPFAELSEEEREKDRVFVRYALEALDERET